MAVIIPLSKLATGTSLSVDVGLLKEDNRTGIVRWEIGKLPNNVSASLSGTIQLPEETQVFEQPTVRAEFQVELAMASLSEIAL